MSTHDSPLALPAPGWILTAYGVGWGAAVALSGLYVMARHEPPIWGGLTLGWGVAAVGAAAGLIIKWMAVRGDLTRFLIWGLMVSGARAAFFLLFIVAVHHSGMAGFRPFLIAVFSGYFTCMVSEIAILHAMTMGVRIEHD